MGDAARDVRPSASTTLGRVAERYAAALEEAAGGERGRGRASLARSRRPPPRSGSRPASRPRRELGERLRRGRPRRERRPPGRPAPRAGRAAPRACPSGPGSAALVVALDAVRYALARRDRRAVDHGRRAHLLRAREELRRAAATSSSAASPSDGYGFVYPVADRAGVRAVRRRCRDAYAAAKAINARRDVARRGPGVLPRAARCSRPRARARRRGARGARSRRWSTRATMMTENAFYPLFLRRRARARAGARAADAACGRSSCSRCARRVPDPRAGGRARAGGR